MNINIVDNRRRLIPREGESMNPSSSFNINQISTEEEEGVTDFKAMVSVFIWVFVVCLCLFFPFFFTDQLGELRKQKDFSFIGTVVDYFRNKMDYQSIRYLNEMGNDVNLSGLYIGNWREKEEGETNGNVKENEEENGKGKMYIRLSHMESKEEVDVYIRLIKGMYIDQWVVLNCKGSLINKNEGMEEVNIFGYYNMTIEYGQNFERANYIKRNCYGDINMTFTGKKDVINLNDNEIEDDFDNYNYNNINNNNNTNNRSIYTSINGELNSNCSVNLTFDGQLEQYDKNLYKITIYSIIVSLLAILTGVSSYWMITKVKDSSVCGNALSLMTIFECIIWDSYSCLSHFFLCMSLRNYFFHFAIPSAIFFIDFSFLDIRLLYFLWILKYSTQYQEQIFLRKRLIKFYLIFYCFLFFSLFFVLKFYFNKKYIIISLFLTWIPQIIFNIYYHNKVSLPLSFIILTNINRFFPTIYFRGYSGNFLEFSTDYYLVTIGAIILIIMTILLYSQTLRGARWFMPKKYKQRTMFECFKTEEEARAIRSDIDHLECLICLSPLIASTKGNNQNSNYYDNDSHIEVNEDVGFVKKERRFYKRKTLSIKEIYTSLFDFHEKSVNIHNKPLMITPCHHIFHSECLESWFKMKKECPNCRKEVKTELLI